MTDRKIEKLLLSEADNAVSSKKEKILSACGVEKSTGFPWKPVLSGVFAAAFLITFAIVLYIPVIYKNEGDVPQTDTGAETIADLLNAVPVTVTVRGLCICDGMAEYIPDNAQLPYNAEYGNDDTDIITQAYTLLAEKYPELINYPRHMMSVEPVYQTGDTENDPDIIFKFNVGGVQTGTEYVYRHDKTTEKRSSVFDGLYDIYLTKDNSRNLKSQLLHDLSLKLRTKTENLYNDSDICYDWQEKDGKVYLTANCRKETDEGYKDYSASAYVYDITDLQKYKETAQPAKREKLQLTLLDDYCDGKYEKYDRASEAVKELYCIAYGHCKNDDVLAFKETPESVGTHEDDGLMDIYLNGMYYASPTYKNSDGSVNYVFMKLVYSCLKNSYIYTRSLSRPEQNISWPDYLSISLSYKEKGYKSYREYRYETSDKLPTEGADPVLDRLVSDIPYFYNMIDGSCTVKNQNEGEVVVITLWTFWNGLDITLRYYEDDTHFTVNEGFFDEIKEEAKRRYN